MPMKSSSLNNLIQMILQMQKAAKEHYTIKSKIKMHHNQMDLR